MNKQKTLKVVNAVMAADFLLLLLTVVFRPVLPYDVYRIAHPVMGYLMAALAAAHIHLNWGWVKQNYLKGKR
jgi:uncharacterized protein (DUF697 family)